MSEAITKAAEAILNKWMAECDVHLVQKMGHQWASQTKHDDLLHLVESALSQAGQGGDEQDAKWRDVALRFDKHRMQALWHLQAMLLDPAKHADVVRQFLKDPSHPDVQGGQGEAVAWMRKTDITEIVDTEPESDGWTPLYAAQPAPVPAPVASAATPECMAVYQSIADGYPQQTAPAVPAGWSIKRESDRAINVQGPIGGCIVTDIEMLDRKIPSEILFALCRDLLSAAPKPEQVKQEGPAP